MGRQWHGYRASNPYPTHGVPLPATPQVYPSKRAQKHPKQPRIEGDRANFNKFHKISHISFSFGPKNMFLGLFKRHGYRYRNPYQYPAVPIPGTRAGLPKPVPFPTHGRAPRETRKG